MINKLIGFLDDLKKAAGEKIAAVAKGSNLNGNHHMPVHSSDARISADENEKCCFCGSRIKRDEINRINKPGYENRPDPYWFYCRTCKLIAEEDITRLKQYEGYNQYAYKYLEMDIKKKNDDRIYEGIKAYSSLMTSQLAAFWLKTSNAVYKTEYLRRIALCGLDPEKAEQMLEFECGILSAFPRPELLSNEFVRIPLLNLREPFLENTFDYYETHFEYPLAYIFKLSDEGEWHFWYSHEKNLPDKVWEEIYMLSDKNKALFGPFAMNLINNMGWTFENVNRFSYFEQRILDVYRWRKMPPESTRIWMK